MKFLLLYGAVITKLSQGVDKNPSQTPNTAPPVPAGQYFLDQNHSNFTNQSISSGRPIDAFSQAIVTLFGIGIIFEAVFSIAGNLVVLWSFKRDAQLRIPRYFYIFNICLCDLIRGAVVMPIAIADILVGLPNEYCMYGIFLAYMLFSESVLSIILISSDRCLMVKNSFNYMRNETNRRTGIKIAASWAVSIAWNALTVLLWRHIEVPVAPEQHLCQADYERSHYIYVFSIVEFLLPLSIISGLNIATYTGIAEAKHIEYHRKDSSKKKKFFDPRGTPLVRVISKVKPYGSTGRRYSKAGSTTSMLYYATRPSQDMALNSRCFLVGVAQIDNTSVINRELTSTDGFIASGEIDNCSAHVSKAPLSGGVGSGFEPTTEPTKKETIVALSSFSSKSSSGVTHAVLTRSNSEPGLDAFASPSIGSLKSGTSSQYNLRKASPNDRNGHKDPMAEECLITPHFLKPVSTGRPIRQKTSSVRFSGSSEKTPPAAKKPLAQRISSAKPSQSSLCNGEHDKLSVTAISCGSTQNHTRVVSSRSSKTRMDNLMRSGKTVNFSLRKVGKSLAILVGLYFICWLPTSVYIVGNRACNDCIPQIVGCVTAFIAYLDPVLNPVIYGLSHKRFAKNFKEICFCTKPQPLHSTTHH